MGTIKSMGALWVSVNKVSFIPKLYKIYLHVLERKVFCIYLNEVATDEAFVALLCLCSSMISTMIIIIIRMRTMAATVPPYIAASYTAAPIPPPPPFNTLNAIAIQM